MSLLRKSMLKNKKGQDYYDLIVAMIGLFLLGFITFGLFTKQYQLSGGLALGTEQFRLLKTYAAAEKALLFVDDAAKLALEQAAYKYGKSGFFDSDFPCGSNGDYSYWARDAVLPKNECVPQPFNPAGCYPDEGVMKSTVAAIFKSKLGNFVEKFNLKSEVKIPFNYEQPFTVSPVVGRTEVIGKSKDAVTITIQNVKYEVKPSFRESIARDIIGDGNSVVTVAKQLFGKPKDEVTALVKAADGQNGLDWDENFDYNKAESPPCTHPVGSCSCCKTVQNHDDCSGKDKDGNPICKPVPPSEVPVGDGVLKEKVPYDSFTVPMSVKVNDPESGTGHRQFFVYDEAEKKVVLKELEYRFALSWIEAHPDEATNCCSCGEGHPCGGGEKAC